MEDASDGKFVIDRATGQISVAKGTGPKFNHLGDDAITGLTAKNSYTVTVIATDPKGIPTKMVSSATEDASDTMLVTINVTPVDEPPIFTVVSDTWR